MRSEQVETHAPRLDALVFGDLLDGEAAQLAHHVGLEGLRFLDVVVPNLTLAGSRLETVQLDGIQSEEADLKGVLLSEVEINRANIPVMRAVRNRWMGVSITGRIGSLEAYESQLRSVHFIGCKVNFLNLNGSELVDVAFTDCTIDELALNGSRARRVSFENTRIARLETANSQLGDFDLRNAEISSVSGLKHLKGATISSDQLVMYAPLMARELGIVIDG